MRELVSDLAFADGPRWHDDRLWLSDMHAHQVVAVDMQGRTEVICELTSSPSGLGWLPDGRLLVVSMETRELLRLEPGGDLVRHADLAGVATHHANDMVVGPTGNAYVGNVGSAYVAGTKRRLADLALVRPDGSVERAANGLGFPNGSVITPDGATLIVAETMGRRLVAFRIAADGTLHDRRVWADLGSGLPDGMCLDAEGAIWYADPRARACVRVAEGGEILARVETAEPCYACALGGPDRRTLFLLTSPTDDPELALAERGAAVFAEPVDVGGAGYP